MDVYVCVQRAGSVADANPRGDFMIMKGRTVSLAMLLMTVFGNAGAAAEPGTAGYRLHAGDKIIVGLYDDEKLPAHEISIAPDGTFAFPMIGEVQAGGKTTAQIRAEMETRLKKYVSEPVVTLAVTEVKGNVAYVVGQVNKPGQLVMNPGLNVLQAISMAGGTNPYAKLDSIIIIRSRSTGQQVLPFKFGLVSSGKGLEQNIDLESGDVVVVP
jgi:polysaccharide export outer membrane protein